MAGEKDGEGADPKLMRMSDGPSAGVGLLNLLCPSRKMCSCLEIQVEEPGPCSQKILNSLLMVDRRRDREGTWQIKTEFPSCFMQSKSWAREDNGHLKHPPVIPNRPNSTVLTQERKGDPATKPGSFA